MPDHFCIRIEFVHFIHQTVERGPLNLGEIIFRPFQIQLGDPANHADADGHAVVPLDVGAGSGGSAAKVDGAVAADDEVVADAEPAASAVPAVDLYGADV